MTASLVKPSVAPEVKPVENVGSLPMIAYFVLAYLGTWVIFIPLIFDPTLSRELFAFLFVISTFTGPTLAAVVVTARTDGRHGVESLLGRVLRWRVSVGWYVAAIFSFMVVWIVGYSIAFDGALLLALIAQPQVLVTVFLPFIVTVSLIPAAGEEIGWRGFALPHLQQRYGPLVGTLILGLLHSLWHLPAFFTPVLGPFEPSSFIMFVITGAAGTFIYTLIFNNARQSILIAVLLHAAGNGASAILGGLLAGQTPTNDILLNLVASGWFNPILFSTVAIALVIATRGRLGYQTAIGDS